MLVNNAGFIRDRMLANTSEEEWDAVIRVHLKGHFATMRHAAEYWRGKSKAGETVDARIINTSSGAGLQGSVGQGELLGGQGRYRGADAGGGGRDGSLRRHGQRDCAGRPHPHDREGVRARRWPSRRTDFDAMAPENMSPLVVWLGSAESREVTGKVFEVEGGMIRVAEGWAHGPQVDKGARWDPSELGPVVADLLAKARPPVPVYGA